MSKRKLKVLSLFHGIGCFNLAIGNTSYEIDTCYTSEICKVANIVDTCNNPRNINIGDVTQWRSWNLDWSSIDLIVAGSPCQGFSSAGLGGNFVDERSKLFFEFVAMKDYVQSINPNLIWLLENVDMKEEWKCQIDNYLGVNRVFINSGEHSPCYRPRNYWSNKVINKVVPENIKICDIISDTFVNSANIVGRRLNPITGKRADSDKDIKMEQYLEVQSHGKARCVTTVSKDCVLSSLTAGRYKGAYTTLVKGVDWRLPTINELCLFHGIPLGYLNSVSEQQARRLIGNGWNVKTITSILEGIL